MCSWRRGVCFGLAACALLASPVEAQETRAAIISAEQAKKAAESRPYEPVAAERLILRVKQKLLEMPSGWYPYLTSVYSGGGFTLGAGYRRFTGDRTFAAVQGLYSLPGYKLIEFVTRSPGHARGRLDLGARLGWRDATQVAFFGLGIDSPQDGRSNFRMKQGYLEGTARVRPVSWVVLDGGVSYEDFTLEEGTGNYPSIEEIYGPAEAPGLGVNPTYLHSMAAAAIDWRPASGYARRGGLYQVLYHSYADRDDTYSFNRLDGELVQHFPILRENWVISLHGAVQTTLDDDDIVPFFLLPSLGSGSTLRAYTSWRFRDRHSLLLSGEFRWIPNRLGLDMAIFYDAGKVTPEWKDLSLDHLKSNVGIGVRFHTLVATPLRIELARGSEGFNLVFAGSAAF
jgi:hypothetical protein